MRIALGAALVCALVPALPVETVEPAATPATAESARFLTELGERVGAYHHEATTRAQGREIPVIRITLTV